MAQTRFNRAMDIDQALPLLGGLSPRQFMKRHWHKKPLLVRQAMPGVQPPLSRSALFELASRDDVESRLVEQGRAAVRAQNSAAPAAGGGWRLKRGPFPRRSLPPLSRSNWTLLVQGVDLHDDAAHAMLQPFRFVPDARLDDLMISYATDGGGVGPHFDSYDVFLLQVQGRRRWRIGRQKDLSLRDDVPLKILAHFEPEAEFVLEPGDLLYLPPRYAHDGVAEGECITCSVGFRSPSRGELMRELLQRLADSDDDAAAERLYADPAQPAVTDPVAVPAGLAQFAQQAVAHALSDPHAVARALGEYLTEPKPQVWFEASAFDDLSVGVKLDRRSRMLCDGRHVFINGESFRAAGTDARLMQRLAESRSLTATEMRRASAGARQIMQGWRDDGWLHATP